MEYFQHDTNENNKCRCSLDIIKICITFWIQDTQTYAPLRLINQENHDNLTVDEDWIQNVNHRRKKWYRGL